MGSMLSLFFGFTPVFLFAYIIYWLDRYEKEPKILLGVVFFWGVIVAAGAAFLINSLMGAGIYLFTNCEATTELATGSLIAPVVEEVLKGFAVLVVYLAARNEFDSIMDGIVYAAIVALGFAATENTYYIYYYGYQQASYVGLLWLAFVRVVLVGWQHPFYTAFFGIGLATTRLSKDKLVRIAAPLGGLSLGILFHAIHNTIGNVIKGGSGLIVSTIFDWSGWSFMLLFVIWAIYREQLWIIDHLQEEVSLGSITLAQYRTACSAWAQSLARVDALFKRRYQITNHFYQLCAELAYKKQHRAMHGEEAGNTKLIEQLRIDLSRYSPLV